MELVTNTAAPVSFLAKPDNSMFYNTVVTAQQQNKQVITSETNEAFEK